MTDTERAATGTGSESRAETAEPVEAPRRRRWRSSETVQTEILDAARDVFIRRGFTAASISEVVQLSGASVGSIYHHFGSKNDLFQALFERHRDEQVAIAQEAVHEARDAGVTDPYELFVAGARAYLGATWARRDLVRVFQLGDTPPGFNEQQRDTGRKWLDANFRLLGATDEPVSRVLIWVVTSFIGEARREICRADSARAARESVDAMIEVLERMRTLWSDAEVHLVVREP